MIADVEQIDPFSLPSVALGQRDQLPNDSGVYFAILNAEILYVGKAVNFQQRWQSHHRINQLKALGNVIIAWFSLADSDKKKLEKLEKSCIGHFKPRFNDLDVPKEFSINPRSVQINARLPEDTSKKIKMLIKSTGYTQTQLMMVAIDRMFQDERLDEMANEKMKSDTLEVVQLSEKAPVGIPGPMSWGGGQDGAEMVTFQQEDGWYGYLRGVKDGLFSEGDDQGPFSSREEAEAELRSQYEEENVEV